MKWEYDIMSAGNRVGKATVVPLGLYYDIQCKCKDLKGIIRNEMSQSLKETDM